MAKILVAEDDRDAGMMVQLILRKGGHQVRLVNTGRAALEACLSEAPDVVLLDVTMPEMSGYEVARALKQQAGTADVPIVFVTGSTETHQKVAGLVLGANDYITKPFHRDELLARVEVAVRIKRQADHLRVANAQLAALSATDELTGIYNRRHLDRRLEEEVARANRHGAALTYLMVDVDHFKRVNDRFGHQEGDRVLQMVAHVMRQSSRISDIVGRYGGEEFAVIAPASPLAAGAVLGERIRANVAAQEIRLNDEPVQVTVSVGIAEYHPSESADSLVATADRALFAAKAAGRNRVVTADTLPAHSTTPAKQPQMNANERK